MKLFNNYNLVGISLLSALLSTYWMLPWSLWREEAAYQSMIEDLLDPEHRISLEMIESRYMEHPVVILKLADFYLTLGSKKKAISLLTRLKTEHPAHAIELEKLIEEQSKD